MEKKVLAVLWNVVDRIDNSLYVSSIVLDRSSLVIEYKNGFKQTYELPFSKQEVIESINKEEILEELKEEVKKLLPNDVSALYQAEINKFKADVETKIKSINTPVEGRDGQDGKDADEDKIIGELKKVVDSKIEEVALQLKSHIPVVKDGLNGRDGYDGVDGKDGCDADEELIANNVVSSVSKVIDTELLNLKESVNTFLATVNIDEFKASFDSLKKEHQIRIEKIAKNITDSLDKKQAELKDELSQYISIEIDKLSKTIKHGADGKDADTDAIIQVLESKIFKFIEERIAVFESLISQEIRKSIELLPPARNGQDGKDADVSKLIDHLQSYIENKLKASIFQVKEDLELYCTQLASDIKTSIIPIKGDKGDDGKRGIQGQRGNGIINIKIDYKDHLIITTNDQVIDAGQIKGKQIFYGGGAGSFKYTNTMPLPFDVGGYKQGTRFNEVEQRVLWTKLLYGLDLPNFGQFSIESIPQNVEVGYQIAVDDYTANFIINNPELLEEDSITITGNGTEILSNLPNSSPIVLPLPEYKLDALGVVNFQIYAYDTTGVSFLKDYACSYKYKIYYGEYTEDIEDTGLPNPMSILRAQELVTDIKGEYLFLDIGYKWFCYPESLGENYVFYEVTSDIAIVFDEVKKISITNNYGVALTYNCFRTLHEINQEFVMGIK